MIEPKHQFSCWSKLLAEPVLQHVWSHYLFPVPPLNVSSPLCIHVSNWWDNIKRMHSSVWVFGSKQSSWAVLHILYLQQMWPSQLHAYCSLRSKRNETLDLRRMFAPQKYFVHIWMGEGSLLQSYLSRNPLRWPTPKNSGILHTSPLLILSVHFSTYRITVVEQFTAKAVGFLKLSSLLLFLPTIHSFGSPLNHS